MYTKAQKKATMKWRENHKEDYTDYQANYMREVFYKKNCDKLKSKRMARYYFDKECKTFRDILL